MTPDISLDIDRIRRASGDAKARKVCLTALERHRVLTGHRELLLDIRHAAKAAESLAAAGIVLPPDLLNRAVFRWEEAAKPLLQEAVSDAIGNDLAAAVSDDLKRCLRATVRELEADLDKLQSDARAICSKHGIAYVRPAAAETLQHAINVFTAELEKPFSVLWHHCARSALNHHMNPDL